MNCSEHLKRLLERYPALACCGQQISDAYDALEACFAGGGKLLVAGNGGSCADAEHIAGELMKGFVLKRKVNKEFSDALKSVDAERGEVLAANLQGALPTIALTGHQALNTAYSNDVKEGAALTFAQQVYGYGREGDVLLAISTSGNSKNVLYAAVAARALKMKVIGLTGGNGGELAKYCAACIKVPCDKTYEIQELHLPVYHSLCLMLEEKFFGE